MNRPLSPDNNHSEPFVVAIAVTIAAAFPNLRQAPPLPSRPRPLVIRRRQICSTPSPKLLTTRACPRKKKEGSSLQPPFFAVASQTVLEFLIGLTPSNTPGTSAASRACILLTTDGLAAATSSRSHGSVSTWNTAQPQKVSRNPSAAIRGVWRRTAGGFGGTVESLGPIRRHLGVQRARPLRVSWPRRNQLPSPLDQNSITCVCVWIEAPGDEDLGARRGAASARDRGPCPHDDCWHSWKNATQMPACVQGHWLALFASKKATQMHAHIGRWSRCSARRRGRPQARPQPAY